VEVRAESPQDWAAIAEVTSAAFGKEREAQMIAAIRTSDGFVPDLSLVAAEEGEIVGHAMLSYVAMENSALRLLELGPISVRPDRQGRGIGGKLIRELLRRADERNEPLVLVLGHPSYYPRFGFQRASEIGLRPTEPEIPDEAFMAVRLKRYDPTITGRVTFPPAYSIS
jgi:putative acetyltransferase